MSIRSRILLVGCLTLAGAPRPVAQGADAIFNDMEQRLMRAAVVGDRAAWNALVADDWTVIHLSGQIITKAEVLRDLFEAKERPMLEASIDEIKVRHLGVAAVVTGRTRVTARDGTRVALRFTDVFSKRNNGWVVVASQATRIAD